jgi:threonine synthase
MISDDLRSELCGGLYVSVVSSGRVENAIPNVYNSYQYLMTPATALAYSGLMDYRSKTGITRTAVVVCDNSPGSEAETVANIMSIPAETIRKMF